MIIILFLSMSIFWLAKKSIYLSSKEREYIHFVIKIFCDYGDELGIQSKEQHEILVEHLNKIRDKISI